MNFEMNFLVIYEFLSINMLQYVNNMLTNMTEEIIIKFNISLRTSYKFFHS